MIDKNKKGFTLVELLVVIAIIGLLSTIAVVSLGSARSKARDTKRIADMKQVATALEQFYADNGGYPIQAAANTYQLIGDTNHKVLCNLNTTPGGASWTTSATCGSNTVYMGNIPAYPTPGQSGAQTNCSAVGAAYCYASTDAWASATGYSTSYKMIWQLENTNPAAGLNGTNCTTSPSGVTCS